MFGFILIAIGLVACSNEGALSGKTKSDTNTSKPAVSAAAEADAAASTPVAAQPTPALPTEPAPPADVALPKDLPPPLGHLVSRPANSMGTPDPTSPEPLTGIWDATGYKCLFDPIGIEQISITQTGTSFVATKVVGDRCVGANTISFQGSLIDGVLHVQFNIAFPGDPARTSGQVVNGTYTPTLIKIEEGDVNEALKLVPHQDPSK